MLVKYIHGFAAFAKLISLSSLKITTQAHVNEVTMEHGFSHKQVTRQVLQIFLMPTDKIFHISITGNKTY